jgi:F0F1-type ATP synthase delta subunit
MVLVQIGLQPNLGAGCVVRTTNKYFDMSLRTKFFDSRDKLRAVLKAPAAEPAPAQTATPQGAAS